MYHEDRSDPYATDMSLDKNPVANTAIPGVASYTLQTHAYASDEYVSREILNTGNWEPFETELTRRLLGVFDLFIDLGANIGWYSALAQHVMAPGGFIHAFEPDPGNLPLLRENVEAGQAVRASIVPAAVSDTVGTAQLFQSPTNLGDHRLYASESDRAAVTVPVTTLDTYFGARSLPPRLVKIDTQGSEPRIFRGAVKTMSPGDADSAYIIEFWPHGMANAGEDIGAYLDYLAQFPHTPFVIEGWNHCLRRTTWAALKQRSETDLAPATMHFADLVLVVPGTAAYLTIADLVQD
jgi:FkbM family methyltransferase